ncbi:MAG: hypothetical protein ABSG35_03560 [Syntrophobacteraceae bacterium]
MKKAQLFLAAITVAVVLPVCVEAGSVPNGGIACIRPDTLETFSHFIGGYGRSASDTQTIDGMLQDGQCRKLEPGTKYKQVGWTQVWVDAVGQKVGTPCVEIPGLPGRWYILGIQCVGDNNDDEAWRPQQ